MNRFLLLAITALSILFLDQCANPIPPTGGPKDTIPPSLISSNPALEELNFNKKLVRLSFDEFINADQIKSNLIITPNQDIKYSHLIKKNDLIIKLQSELTDSTTYIFNFFNGVTDITEKNPVEKLILALGNVNGIGCVDDRITVTNPEPESTFYEVQKGDSLSKIAKAHYDKLSPFCTS